MLVLKSPARIIYDSATDLVVEAEYSQVEILSTLANYYQVLKSDMDILTELFCEDHPIFNDFGRSSYWVCKLKEPALRMSHEAALRIMMQVSAGNSVPLADMAAWMGTTTPVLRAHLRTLADEYLQHLAQRYSQRHDRNHWQITDERFEDKYIRMAYAECVFIVKKMLPGIA